MTDSLTANITPNLANHRIGYDTNFNMKDRHWKTGTKSELQYDIETLFDIETYETLGE